MKKILLSFMAAFALSCAAGFAQGPVKYNYIKNGYTYTGTELRRFSNGKDLPIDMRLTRVDLGSKGDVYVLRAFFEDSAPSKIPVGCTWVFHTRGKGLVSLKNSYNSPNLVAPNGLGAGSSKTWWNCGEYYLEENDVLRIMEGIMRMDVMKRFSESGRVTYRFNTDDDSFAKLLGEMYHAVKDAPKPRVTIGSNLNSIQDRGGNRLVDTKKLGIGGDNGISLAYLYYAPSNSESYDMNIFLPGSTVPFNSVITVKLTDGSTIKLRQEKEMVPGHVLCYPTAEQLRRMARGVERISISTTGQEVLLTFPDGKFASAVDQLYNELQTVAIL